MRTLALVIAAATFTGCVFSSDSSNNDFRPDDGPGDLGASDVRTIDDAGDPPDDGDPTPDVGPVDTGQPDLAGEDMGVDLGPPDMGPPPRPPSAVCVDGTSSNLIGADSYRLRTHTSEARLSVGYMNPGRGVDIVATYWSQWDTFELWVGMQYAGSDELNDEVLLPEATGIASVPWFGAPGGFITRRSTQGCLYAEWNSGGSGSIDCGGAWGADVGNTSATIPRYFWFGEGGTINSMPADDLQELGQRITVPWCAADPDDPTSCLPLQYGSTEAKANNGPFILLSDSVGRAYAWDLVQNIDGTNNLEDCVTPPTAPIPIMIDGAPAVFANIDVVNVNGANYLLHQTAASVDLHPLSADFQPMPATEQLPNNGISTYFDAATDGTRIAAVAGVGSDVRIFAFGAGGGTRDVVVDSDPQFLVRDVGCAVQGDQVAVTAGGSGIFVVRANGYVMWQ